MVQQFDYIDYLSIVNETLCSMICLAIRFGS